MELARLRQEVTDLSARLAEATQHARTLQQERQELIAAQERKVREVDAELATMLGHIKELTAEAAAADDRAHTLQEKVAAWELLGGQKDTDRARVQSELALVTEQLTTAQASHEARAAGLLAEVAARDREASTLRVQLAEAADALTTARADADTRRDASAAQAKQDRDELERTRAQLKDTSDKLSALVTEYLAYKEATEKNVAEYRAATGKTVADLQQALAESRRGVDLRQVGRSEDHTRVRSTSHKTLFILHVCVLALVG